MFLFNLAKRVMIYGYFLFIGYQLLQSLNNPKNTEFSDSVNKFETLFNKQFTQVYQTVPQLVQFKLQKYPVLLVSSAAFSVLFGGFFGIFTLASHVLVTYLTNQKLVNLVMSVNPKMDFVNFAQNLELDVILLLALYLGVLTQFINSLFYSKAAVCCAEDHTVTASAGANRNTATGSKQKKRI